MNPRECLHHGLLYFWNETNSIKQNTKTQKQDNTASIDQKKSELPLHSTINSIQKSTAHGLSSANPS